MLRGSLTVRCFFSEALTVMPMLAADAVPGLAVGCLLANLLGGAPWFDVLFGTLATLLAALWTSKMPNRWLAPLPPVICNGVILGAMFSWYEVGFGPGFWGLFAWNAFTVALGELAACYVLGSLLLTVLPKVESLRRLMPQPAKAGRAPSES